jgi:ketosteroid isomerase-like protein
MKQLANSRTLTLIACLTALFASASVPATANDQDAARKAVNDFAETWNRHDMTAFGNLFMADADFVNVGGRRWKGREEIQRNHAFMHATIPQDASGVDVPPRAYGLFKTSIYRFDRIDVRLLRNDVAVAHGAWTMTGDARTSEPRQGMMTFVLRLDGDRWLIAAAQNTEIARRVS